MIYRILIQLKSILGMARLLGIPLFINDLVKLVKSVVESKKI